MFVPVGLNFLMWNFSAGNVWFNLFPGSHKIWDDCNTKIPHKRKSISCISCIPLLFLYKSKHLGHSSLRHKSPGIHQITAELIKQGVEQFAWRFINYLFLFGRRKNWLTRGKSRSYYIFKRRGIKQIAVIIEVYHSCQPLTEFYLTSCCQG